MSGIIARAAKKTKAKLGMGEKAAEKQMKKVRERRKKYEKERSAYLAQEKAGITKKILRTQKKVDGLSDRIDNAAEKLFKAEARGKLSRWAHFTRKPYKYRYKIKVLKRKRRTWTELKTFFTEKIGEIDKRTEALAEELEKGEAAVKKVSEKAALEAQKKELEEKQAQTKKRVSELEKAQAQKQIPEKPIPMDLTNKDLARYLQSLQDEVAYLRYAYAQLSMMLAPWPPVWVGGRVVASRYWRSSYTWA